MGLNHDIFDFGKILRHFKKVKSAHLEIQL